MNNYDTEINPYNKQSLNKKSYYNSIMLILISERLGTSYYHNKLILQII